MECRYIHTYRRDATYDKYPTQFTAMLTEITSARSTKIKTNHCHPLSPPCRCNVKAPAEISDPKAPANAGPKKNIAVRCVSSLGAYHVDKMYRPPGMNPLSASPRNNRATYHPPALVTNSCNTSIKPQTTTWAGIQQCGPTRWRMICLVS